MHSYDPEGELYFYRGNEQEAYKVADILLHNDYVVMLSKEEGATILSYLNTCEASEANRNYVAFMRYDDLEDLVLEDTEEEIDSAIDNISKNNWEKGVELMKAYANNFTLNQVDESFWEDEDV